MYDCSLPLLKQQAFADWGQGACQSLQYYSNCAISVILSIKHLHCQHTHCALQLGLLLQGMQGGAGRTGVEGAGLRRRQAAMYGLGLVVVQYIWNRADVVAAAHHWGEQDDPAWAHALWRGMRWTETAFKLGSLANFLAFLRYGKYRYGC